VILSVHQPDLYYKYLLVFILNNGRTNFIFIIKIKAPVVDAVARQKHTKPVRYTLGGVKI
jgi:hypothetical protein